MIFFGWGRKASTAQLDPQRALVLSYGYFHLFWLFRVAFGRQWQLATLTEAGWATRPLSAEEVTALGAEQRLRVGWWWQWGLLVALGALAVVLTIGSLSS